MNRSPLGVENREYAYLHVRLSKEMHKAMHEFANEQGLAASSWVRMLIVREMKKAQKDAA